MNHTSTDSAGQGGPNSKSIMGKALALWQAITGVKAGGKSFNLSNWDIHKTYEQIQRAIDLDPTEVTALMLLTHFHNEFIANRSFSMRELLEKPALVEAKLQLSRDLIALLSNPALQAEKEAFTQSVSEALRMYGAAERDDVVKLLATPDHVALLRRDALKSMSQLRVDQFLDGQAEPDHVKPVYVKTVHQWWNINSLINAALSLPSGVSLNLIRHPEEHQSYFAFVIRNGGNLFVLSDFPEYSHPLQGYMSRRPDRHLHERAERNWFPYELLGMAYDEETGEMYFKTTSERGLVPYQNAALPLQPIAELGAAEVVWLSMMFDLIVERFWKQGYKAPALSYTGEMLKIEHALLEAAKSSGVAVVNYNPAGLPALTPETIRSDSVTEEEVGKKGPGGNRWMEERYGAQVSMESLNLLGAPEETYAITKNGELVKVDERAETKLGYFEREDRQKGRLALKTFDATSFGPRDRLDKDRKFIARVNFAAQITRLAEAEFQQRGTEVRAWYEQRVKRNVDALLDMAAYKELWVYDGVVPCFSHNDSGAATYYEEVNPSAMQSARHRVRKFMEFVEIAGNTMSTYKSVTLGDDPFRGRDHICAINDTKATYFVMFYPSSPAELAMLAGCSVSDLPDVLQHWSTDAPYVGNSILSRIDPMHWVAKNPWKELVLKVRIPLSKRAAAAVEKRVRKPLPDGVTATRPTPMPSPFVISPEAD